jgi:dihydropteroate synthase
VKLRLAKHTIELQQGAPLVMGIVNIGHDSVADSRSLRSLEAQRAFALRQHEDGAHILDIGVQSGRTDTPIISEEEEIERLLPLVSALADEGIVVSVDLWRAAVADAAVSAGASIINDVGGLADAGVADVAARTGAALVVMHTRAAPKVERFPGYDDPMADVISFLDERIEQALAAGVEREQIVVDPGLDYAKTPHESIEVLRDAHRQRPRAASRGHARRAGLRRVRGRPHRARARRGGGNRLPRAPRGAERRRGDRAAGRSAGGGVEVDSAEVGRRPGAPR